MGKAIVFLVVFFLAPTLGALLGAFSGWLTGLIFSTSINEVLSQIGISDIELWKIGATLGFVGSFVRRSGNYNGVDGKSFLSDCD